MNKNSSARPLVIYSNPLYAALQLLSGERDKVISELMGHTDVHLTRRVYQQVLPFMREAASDCMERLLFADVRTTLAQSVTEQVM